MIVNAGEPARGRGAHRVEHAGIEHAGRNDRVRPAIAQHFRNGARGVGRRRFGFVSPSDCACCDAETVVAGYFTRKEGYGNAGRRESR